MHRWLILLLLLAWSVGCESGGGRNQLGPPPDPFFATRAPRQIAPIPAPPPPAPSAAPRARAPGGTSLSGTRIVLDAGHGGHDPGALGRGPLPEKHINLAVARLLARELRARGAQVTMTRDSDRFLELDTRAAIADRTRTDLFVSLHADSARRASASGMTIYIARGPGGVSRRVAMRIAAAAERAGLEFRGVEPAGFRVLVGHSRPAILVECGFLSNAAEAQRLAQPEYQARVADAIAEGIAEHFGR